MGQPMDVGVKETLDPNVLIFETNRWLTGMGTGLYEDAGEAPEGSMARMIFDTGKIAAVNVYGSTITVTKARDASWDAMSDEIKKNLENFYIYYPENIGKKFVAAAGDGDEELPGTDDDEEAS